MLIGPTRLTTCSWARGIMQGVHGEGISRWFRDPLAGIVVSIAISILIIVHPIGFETLLTVVMSLALLMIGIEITVKGVAGRQILGKIPNSKKS